MKPIPDAMYHSVVKMGMYCPMAAEKKGNTMLSFRTSISRKPGNY